MNIGLVLAGGVGNRVGGDVPKQYMKVGGKCVISYCLETMLFHEALSAVQIVAEEKWYSLIRAEINLIIENRKDKCAVKKIAFSVPGANRQLSILNGLRDISNYADADSFVMIHDAARPMLDHEMISAYLEKVVQHDGLIPALPMKDTVYISSDREHITGLLERSQIFAGQAPEVFRLGKYLRANELLLPDAIMQMNGSTEPAVLAGLDIKMVPGNEKNFKITTPEDLDRFKKIVEKMI